MTLIDHFNAFQRVSKTRGFTANVRSLYYALLGEFNELMYPSELVLENTYLQHLSGIRSTSSFDAARGVLINAGLIKYHKINPQRQRYELVEPHEKTEAKGFRKSTENEPKMNRKPAESRLGLLTVHNQTKQTPQEKDKDKDAEGDAPAPATMLSVNSKEVLEAWRLWGGQTLYGGHALTLIEYERKYGKAKLLEAIVKAGRADKKGVISLDFLEKILERDAVKFVPTSGKISEYGGVDIAPGM